MFRVRVLSILTGWRRGDLPIRLISLKQLVNRRQVAKSLRPKRFAGVTTNERAEPFAQLPRLGRNGIERSRSRVCAKMGRHFCRNRMSLFEPGNEVAACSYPLDLGAPRGSETVEKIEREIVADEEGRG